jgi:hypothetical protein
VDCGGPYSPIREGQCYQLCAATDRWIPLLRGFPSVAWLVSTVIETEPQTRQSGQKTCYPETVGGGFICGAALYIALYSPIRADSSQQTYFLRWMQFLPLASFTCFRVNKISNLPKHSRTRKSPPKSIIIKYVIFFCA